MRLQAAARRFCRKVRDPRLTQPGKTCHTPQEREICFQKSPTDTLDFLLWVSLLQEREARSRSKDRQRTQWCVVPAGAELGDSGWRKKQAVSLCGSTEVCRHRGEAVAQADEGNCGACSCGATGCQARN